MARYYLMLGLRHLRRAPVLTALIVVTLAAGVSVSMATLTVLYMMSADPIPQKSDRLFAITIDNLPVEGLPPDADVPTLLTWTDVRNLREDGFGLRGTGMYGVSAIVSPPDAGARPFFGEGIAVDGDFFAMMDTPFRYGAPWGDAADRDEARVVVIGTEIAERVFGADVDPVGETIEINAIDWQVVGVLEPWRPLPVFYAMQGGITQGNDVFVPLSTALALRSNVNGNTSCFQDADPGFDGLMASECVWLRYWVELESAAERDALDDYLAAYVTEQKTLGRLPRPDRSRAYDVREWLAHLEIVDNDTVMQTWLAFGFLAVCLINTIGLLLAKFGARSGDIAVRRALGASRPQIFAQYLSEAAVLGLVGSLVGIGLAFGLLRVLAAQSDDLEALARMDPTMLLTTVLLSIGAAIVAGLLPTWRATQVTPALQLKTQ